MSTTFEECAKIQRKLLDKYLNRVIVGDESSADINLQAYRMEFNNWLEEHGWDRFRFDRLIQSEFLERGVGR